MRIFVNLEFSLLDMIKQEKIRSEKKALFFGTRLGLCDNDIEILNNFEKEPTSEANTKEYVYQVGDSGFKYQIKVIKNMQFLVIDV